LGLAKVEHPPHRSPAIAFSIITPIHESATMLSLRSLARAAPRSAARYSAKAVRPQASLFRPTAAVQPAFSHAVPRLAAAFSLSTARRQENSSNEELVAKLQSEIAMESEMKESDDLSANIKEYLENSPFEVCPRHPPHLRTPR
jgi:complement component 1 Q subcomponent-binding protein